jgi:hypothetical protein
LLSGITESADFPVTPTAFDTSFSSNRKNSFLSVIELPQVLLHSTYIGGQGEIVVTSTAIDSDENVLICGTTTGPDFPCTPDGYDTVYHDNWEYGDDGFIGELSADLSTLRYGSYLGGWLHDNVYSILLDGQDSIWVGGYTSSADFPVTPNAFQTHRPGWDSNFLSHLYIGHGPDTSNVSDPNFILHPASFSLSVFPNPFNPSTTISFTLPIAGEVKIGVYDVLGREMNGMKDGHARAMSLQAGPYNITFDGSGMASGVYFVRVVAGTDVKVKKMQLLR